MNGERREDLIGFVRRAVPARRDRLGEHLVRTGRIEEEDVRKALRMLQAGEKGLRIGSALVRLGLLTESDIAEALAAIHGMEAVGRSQLEARPEVVSRLPEALVREHLALPLRLEDGCLVVAVERPLPPGPLRALERAARAPLSQRIAPTGPLRNAIALAYTGVKVVDSEGMTAVEIIDDIVVKAVKHKVSDIHLEPLEERIRLRFRVDGVLREMETFPHEQYLGMVARVKVLAGMNIAEKRAPQDGAIAFSKGGIEIDLRVSSLPSLHGEKVVMRLLAGRSSQITIDQIGLSVEVYERFQSLVKRPYGIVLIVGPTGSGKSTTLTAALNTINTPDVNIVTVEDPVEYKIPGITQVHVGQNAKLTFAGALRSILRQDPDVIMVGETRDSETADISLRAALTGHMVFTTLHTNDAPSSLPRLVDMGCEPFLVASSVTGVLAQRLVRKLCRHCREAYAPSDDEATFLELPPDPDRRWFRACGCPECNGVGYSGRLGIFEFLEVTREVQRLVMDGAPAEELARQSLAQGMRTLRQDAIAKLESGTTSFQEVVRVTVG